MAEQKTQRPQDSGEDEENLAVITFTLRDTAVSQVLRFPLTTTIAALKKAVVRSFNVQTGLVDVHGPREYQFEDHQMLSSYKFLADAKTACITVTETMDRPEYSMPDQIDVVIKSSSWICFYLLSMLVIFFL